MPKKKTTKPRPMTTEELIAKLPHALVLAALNEYMTWYMLNRDVGLIAKRTHAERLLKAAEKIAKAGK